MNKKKQKFSANQWKILASMITNYSTFTIGVFVVFMLHLGLSLGEVSIALSAYLIFISIGQIPSGIFADRHGYRNSLVIGSLFFLAGTTLIAFAQNFYWFLTAYSLIGFGSAMKEGADHALLYECLKADGKEKSFKKTAGRLEFFTNFFWVVTAISGGLLYTIAERLPFYAEIVVVSLCLLIVATAKEPKKKSKHSPVWAQIKSSVKQTFSTPNFSKIFVFSALIGSIAITAFQYLQPLYKSLEINEGYFGLIAAGAFAMRGLGAWSAHTVGKIFSTDKYLILHASIFGLFLILFQKTSTLLFIFPIIAIFFFLRGLYTPTMSTYINEKVDSSNRATMLSVNSQLLTVASSISLLFTGYIADKYDLPAAFFAISIASIILLILYVLSLSKVKAG